MQTNPEVLTGNNLLIAAGVLVALCIAFNAVASAIKNWRDLKKPEQDVGQHVRTCLDTDKARLDAQEKRIAKLEDGQRVMCVGVMALLEHELHNGNTEQMQSASQDLQRYLINK